MKPLFPSRNVAAFLLALGAASFVGADCQQIANDVDGAGSGSTVDAGTTGSVCCGDNGSCSDGLNCCLALGGACTGDYDCCDGLCSGGTSTDGISSASGTCVSSGNDSCHASLGSRCTSVATCACTTTDDCCQEGTGAVCAASTVTSAGSRCCLQTGTPCEGDGDCCTSSCDTATYTCD